MDDCKSVEEYPTIFFLLMLTVICRVRGCLTDAWLQPNLVVQRAVHSSCTVIRPLPVISRSS